jgi:hypothetical protein
MENPQQYVRELIGGYWAAQVACAAAALSLPDQLAKGPATAEDLANAVGAHAPSVYRLLRGMVSLGLCTQEADGRFALTEAGNYLREGMPGSVRGRALFIGDRLWKQFSDLTHQVKTGGHTQTLLGGTEGFEAMRNDPAGLHTFQQAMAESSRTAAQDALKVYGFGRFRRVLDLGGGYGGVLGELLKAHPGQTGAVFDLPFLKDGAEGYLAGAGVKDRAEFMGGSFFEAVPSGFDLILMKFIIHDWSDPEARTILQKSRAAADADTTLVLIEQMVPDVISCTPEHQAVIRGDLTMLGIGGKERTAEEYRVLLAECGWTLTGITPSAVAFHVIEAKPA